eukprot:CAMPEP_0179238570 /NCGR_PEP_ID=MMETSP0797-20121207/15014_1 /TAXON_ID=47934 /ORGANISM="Dinophysis acuminata, Strain DAEP01" /LENGTH=367 /DNA_ID=CAMNT_0020945867 /DNA_START=99 /DNA_END=1202 /DNA_ORIENTATION=+
MVGSWQQEEDADFSADDGLFLERGKVAVPISARLQVVKKNPLKACGCGMFASIGALVVLALNCSSPQTLADPSSLAPTPKQMVPVCDYDEFLMCPAWTLFSNGDIHWAATENLMHIGDELFGHLDFEEVKTAVPMGFKGIAAQFQRHAPTVVRDLNSKVLSQSEANAVTKSFWALSTPEVQTLGVKIARIIKQIPATATADDLTVSIEDSMASDIGEIESLTVGTVPDEVRQRWGKQGPEHEWGLTLSPRSIDLMRRYDASSPCDYASMSHGAKSLVIYAAVLELGKVFVELLRPNVLFEQDSAARELIDGLYDSIVLPEDSNDAHCMQALLWPLRCGIQGLDAMRAANDWGARARGSKRYAKNAVG